jgi:hypothetical protein
VTKYQIRKQLRNWSFQSFYKTKHTWVLSCRLTCSDHWIFKSIAERKFTKSPLRESVLYFKRVADCRKAFEQAIAKLKNLPANEQDAITAMILAELEDERRWDEAFARSPDMLAKLATEAMAEYRAGQTQELDPDTL